MQYVLETKGLCKQYKNFQALADLNMHVPKGSIYGFVGKNGAGKTTLIRVITGLQNPTSGSYRLYEIPDSDKMIRQSRRRMGAAVAVFPLAAFVSLYIGTDIMMEHFGIRL